MHSIFQGITHTNQIRVYNTRQSEFDLTLPKPNTIYMKKAFAYTEELRLEEVYLTSKVKSSVPNFVYCCTYYILICV